MTNETIVWTAVASAIRMLERSIDHQFFGSREEMLGFLEGEDRIGDLWTIYHTGRAYLYRECGSDALAREWRLEWPHPILDEARCLLSRALLRRAVFTSREAQEAGDVLYRALMLIRRFEEAEHAELVACRMHLTQLVHLMIGRIPKKKCRRISTYIDHYNRAYHLPGYAIREVVDLLPATDLHLGSDADR